MKPIDELVEERREDVLGYLKHLLSFRSVNPHVLGGDDPDMHALIEKFLKETDGGEYLDEKWNLWFKDFYPFSEEENNIQCDILGELESMGFECDWTGEYIPLDALRAKYPWAPVRQSDLRGLVHGFYTPKNPKGAPIIFNGHVDTVGSTEAQTEANLEKIFELREDDEAIYCRGACDMKAGIAAFMKAIGYAIESGKPMRPVMVQTVVDEEAGGCGLGTLKVLVKNSHDPIFSQAVGAVVAEPTSCRVCNTQYGMHIGKVIAHGKGGHDAAKGLVDPVDQIYEVRERLKAAGATLGRLQAGSWVPAPPATAEQGFSIKYKHGEDPGLPDLEGINELRHLPSYATDPESELVQSALNAARASALDQDEPERFAAWSDAYHLSSHGIPTIVCGPGSINQAHAADEYVLKDEVLTAVKMYMHMLFD